MVILQNFILLIYCSHEQLFRIPTEMNAWRFFLILFLKKGEFLIWIKTAKNLAPTHT